MTSILRNQAATVDTGLQRARLTGGGSGRGAVPVGTKRIEAKLRRPDDPAAELLPAAEFLGHETDFGAILEDFEGSPFDPARRRVLGRLMGMFAMDYQGAQPEERRFLRRLLSAGNPREGYVANRGLHLCGASHVIRRTLALGVAESRFEVRPNLGFLGAVQARIAATTLRLLGPVGREAVWNLLVQAGQGADGRPLALADRVIERALILKALGARRHRLGPWSRDGVAALDEIARFAVSIRGSTRPALAARTILEPLDDKRLPPAAKLPASLVARLALQARAAIDPTVAWEVHDAPPERVAGADAVGDERDDAMPDVDRGPLQDRPRLHMALAEARAARDGRLDDKQALALADYVAGRELNERRLGLKDEALAVLMARGFDLPPASTLEAIREDAQGIYRFDAARAFGDLLSRYSGASYVRRVFSDQLTAGSDPLAQIRRALRQGLSVPVTIQETRSPVARAFAALTAHEDAQHRVFAMREPARNLGLMVPEQMLAAMQLPEAFGKQARAEAFLAPAALDLLAPPFGIAFPALGIEDRL